MARKRRGQNNQPQGTSYDTRNSDPYSSTNLPGVDQGRSTNSQTGPMAEWRTAFDDYMNTVPQLIQDFQGALREYIATGGQGAMPGLNLGQPPMPGMGGAFAGASGAPQAPPPPQAPAGPIGGGYMGPQGGNGMASLGPGIAAALQSGGGGGRMPSAGQQQLMANGVPGGGYMNMGAPAGGGQPMDAIQRFLMQQRGGRR